MFKEGSKKMAEEEIEELENEIRILNIEIRDLTLDLEDCKQRNRGR